MNTTNRCDNLREKKKKKKRGFAHSGVRCEEVLESPKLPVTNKVLSSEMQQSFSS